MKANELARRLGRRGGQARARRLSAQRRQEIASRGGEARALSLKVAQRIRDNFRYVEAMNELSNPPKIKRVSTVKHTLPDIHGS